MNTGLLMSLLTMTLMLFSQHVNADITIKVKGSGGIVVVAKPDGTTTSKVCPIKDDAICATIIIETSAEYEGTDLILNMQRFPIHIVKFGSSMEAIGSTFEFNQIR